MLGCRGSESGSKSPKCSRGSVPGTASVSPVPMARAGPGVTLQSGVKHRQGCFHGARPIKGPGDAGASFVCTSNKRGTGAESSSCHPGRASLSLAVAVCSGPD